MATPSGRHNRAKLTVLASQVLGSHTNYPVTLVWANMPAAMASGDNRCADDGGDLYFGNADGSILYPVDIRAFDRVAAEASMVVTIPSVTSASNTDFYVFWGKSNTEQPDRTAEGGRDLVYSESGIYSCWPLNEETGDFPDRTENMWDGARRGGVNTANGKIYKSSFFTGSSERVDISYSAAEIAFEAENTAPPSAFTVSSWVYWNGQRDSARKAIFGKFTSGSGWKLTWESDEKPQLSVDGGINDAYAKGGTVLSSGQWYHIVGSHDGTGLAAGTKIYVDGIDASTTRGSTVTGSIQCADRVGIADQSGNDDVEEWAGRLEEVRYERSERSADWIRTIYNNQNSPSTFITTGTREAFGDTTRQKSLKITTKGDFVLANMANKDLLIDEKQITTTMWANAKGNGGDIFASTDSAGSIRIPLEVVTFNNATQKAQLWVNLSIISAVGGNTCYLHYDAAEDEEQPFPDNTLGRNAVWSPNNYVGVWHLGETGDGSTSEYVDSSGTANDGTGHATTGTGPTQTTGQIGEGQDFVEANEEYIQMPENSFPTGNNPSVISAWGDFRDTIGSTDEVNLLAYGTNAEGERRVVQQRDEGVGLHFSHSFFGQLEQLVGRNHIAAIVPDGATMTGETRIVINGNEISGVFLAGIDRLIDTNLDEGPFIGTNTGDPFPSGAIFNEGMIDEVRIAAQEMTAAWIKVDYYNQLNTENIWSPDEVTNEDLLECCQEVKALLRARGFRRERPSRQELMDKLEQSFTEMVDIRKYIRLNGRGKNGN